jgi:dolichol-phosphate mannosyltransferase
MDSLVIVPTYNEADNLDRLARAILDLEGFDLLVVDDNSPDGTGRVAEELRDRYPDRISILHRPSKLGIGTAYLEGFRIALTREYPYVFQMDADFSHDPADLPRLRDALGRADVALGSRYVSGGGTTNWPLWRRALSRCGSLYASLLLGVPVADLTGGFKGFRRPVLQALDLASVRSNGYAFQIEVTYRCWQQGFRIVEVPITFVERRSGRSKMSSRIVVEAALLVWQLRFEELSDALARLLKGSVVGPS